MSKNINIRSVTATDKVIGQKIAIARGMLNLTAANLAEKLNISTQQLYKYEIGQNRVAASSLFKISKILNCDLNYFFEEANLGEANLGEAEPICHKYIKLFVLLGKKLKRIQKVTDKNILEDIIKLLAS